MFLYELISLYFPFEKQNLMGSQIEKLIIEGERPTLQNRVRMCNSLQTPFPPSPLLLSSLPHLFPSFLSPSLFFSTFPHLSPFSLPSLLLPYRLSFPPSSLPPPLLPFSSTSPPPLHYYCPPLLPFLLPSLPFSPLPSQELNNPILYLDTMRWCWQQDYRSRPSADQLVGSIANESVSRLVDAISLHNTTQITCACICTLPIQILSPELNSSLLDDDRYAALPASPSGPSSVAQGDLQEDLWLCMYTPGGEEEEETVGSGGEGEEEGARAEVCIINFKRKASLFTEVRVGGV